MAGGMSAQGRQIKWKKAGGEEAKRQAMVIR